MKKNLENMFELILNSGVNVTTIPKFSPKIDLIENDKEIIVLFEIPGMEKENIKITYENETLKISGEKLNKNEGLNYYYKEIAYGKFERTIYLNENVLDVTNIDANIFSGLLEIKIQKKEVAKPKEIEIK